MFIQCTTHSISNYLQQAYTYTIAVYVMHNFKPTTYSYVPTKRTVTRWPQGSWCCTWFWYEQTAGQWPGSGRASPRTRGRWPNRTWSQSRSLGHSPQCYQELPPGKQLPLSAQRVPTPGQTRKKNSYKSGTVRIMNRNDHEQNLKKKKFN